MGDPTWSPDLGVGTPLGSGDHSGATLHLFPSVPSNVAPALQAEEADAL